MVIHQKSPLIQPGARGGRRSGTRGINRSPSVSMLGLSPVAGAVLAAKYWPNDGVICALDARDQDAGGFTRFTC